MVDITDIFTANYKLLFRIVYSQTGDVEDTKDVLQDTYLKAYRALRQHIPSAKLLPWLIVIAKNTSRTHMKKQRNVYPMDNLDEQYAYEPDLLGFVIHNALQTIFAMVPEDIRVPLKESLIDEIPLKRIARSYNIEYARLRYWKKKIVSYMSMIID